LRAIRNEKENSISMKRWRNFREPLLGAALVLLVAAALPSSAPAQLRSKPGADAIAAGTAWRESLTGVEFVYVPGGEFEQGCGAWITNCSSDAKPSRRVKLDSFWIAKTEITQGQWRTMMGVNPSRQRPGERYPTEQVSWIQAQEFVHRLNDQSGRGIFSLPTEAQWEFACRSGGKRIAFGTADGKLDRQSANYGTDSCCGPDATDGYSQSSPAGTYPPNTLGLHDMTGNLWEWVQDNYDGSAYLSGRVTNPMMEDKGPTRVIRGGSFTSSPGISRCTDRRDMGAETRYFDVGFRVVRIDVPPKKTAQSSRPFDPNPAPDAILKPDDLPAALVAPKSNWQKWAHDHNVPLDRCC
jgi:formylglycine-generating enzyme required for sulfatase activity